MFRRLGVTVAVAALGLLTATGAVAAAPGAPATATGTAGTAATATGTAATATGTAATATGTAAATPTATPTLGPPPVVAGLTITPSTVALGGSVTVVATGTNTTGKQITGADLGIQNPSLLPITGLTHSPECHSRNLQRLVYCTIGAIAAGATTNLTLTFTPTQTGTFPITMYTGPQTPSYREYLSGTITVY